MGGARAGAATNSCRGLLIHHALLTQISGPETYKLGVANELATEPEERLLEVVVGLGGDVVVLEVLLSVEGDSLGLDLALLHIDLVTAENDGNVLANSDEITY